MGSSKGSSRSIAVDNDRDPSGFSLYECQPKSSSIEDMGNLEKYQYILSCLHPSLQINLFPQETAKTARA